MPIRLFALALLAPLFFTGCMVQRDSADMDDTPTDSGAPNVYTYVYGSWDYTMTPLDGGETLTGTLTIPEEGMGRFTSSSGLDAALETQSVSVTGPNVLLSGTVQAGEPFSLTLAGSTTGDTMEAEANLEGMGAYHFVATRAQE